MSRYIAALDQGTTSSRCIIFDDESNIISSAQKEFEQFFPQSGWVEHNPLDIYLSQYTVLMEAVEKSGIALDDLAAIGIANQRETTIMWDKRTGHPIHNAIVWQCRRTAPICEEIAADKELSRYIKTATGLIPDAYFSATKIKWLLDNIEGARQLAEEGNLMFGTVDTWLIWKMTVEHVHVTDMTNASRTMLFNIHSLCWDEKILNALEIPQGILPTVKSCSEVYGHINIAGHMIPVAGMAGDQQAALFGQLCLEKGELKNTCGTGNFLLVNTGDEPTESRFGLLTTIACSIGGRVTYALEGSVFSSGATTQWLRDEMGFFGTIEDAVELAKDANDSGGVYLVPAFTGLGAPFWDMYARAAIFGLSRGTTKGQLIRAAFEAVAYRSNDVFTAMENDIGCKIDDIRVDGGVSRNEIAMQFMADISGKRILKPVIDETTALGAAFLAGLAVGVWDSTAQLRKTQKISRYYEPSMTVEERAHRLERWNRALECVGRFSDNG